MLLSAVMQQYEARYGLIDLTAARSEPPQPAQELSAMGAAKPHAVQ